MGKATGEDGVDGVNGDSIFKGVTQDDDNVYFELADGSVITVSKSAESSSGGEDTRIITFKDETVKNICVANWDINGDGELSKGEAARVTSIRKFFRGTNIKYFEELQYFTGIDEIGEEAFNQCYDLISIVIPDNVLWIEEYAFNDCTSLLDIVIPDHVTWIGANAFSNCCSVSDIVIPNSVTYIGYSAFNECGGLEFVTIGSGVRTIEGSVFYGCCNLKNIVIPDSVTSIGNSAFSYCISLTEIIIPNGVTYIGTSAFSNCNSLVRVTIGRSVTSIGVLAFNRCSSLTEIVIPEGVTFIGSSAFSACGNLQKIYCTPTIPPTLESNSIFSGIHTDAIIYVPEESVDSYKSAGDWSDYVGKIVGYAF